MKSIVICPGTSNDYLAHFIDYEKLFPFGKCCQLYSKRLVNELLSVGSLENIDHIIHFQGKYYPSHNAIEFDLNCVMSQERISNDYAYSSTFSH